LSPLNSPTFFFSVFTSISSNCWRKIKIEERESRVEQVKTWPLKVGHMCVDIFPQSSPVPIGEERRLRMICYRSDEASQTVFHLNILFLLFKFLFNPKEVGRGNVRLSIANGSQLTRQRGRGFSSVGTTLACSSREVPRVSRRSSNRLWSSSAGNPEAQPAIWKHDLVTKIYFDLSIFNQENMILDNDS
jgi:hypothetical protein